MHGITERGFRINPKWRDIQPGDPVVSDYIRKVLPQGLAFVPFLFEPKIGEPDRTNCPLGGSLSADLCWHYGQLTDLPYADFG